MDEVRKSSSGLSQLDRVLSDGFRRREPGKAELYTQMNSFNMVNRNNLPGSFQKGPTPIRWLLWEYPCCSSLA